MGAAILERTAAAKGQNSATVQTHDSLVSFFLWAGPDEAAWSRRSAAHFWGEIPGELEEAGGSFPYSEQVGG